MTAAGDVSRRSPSGGPLALASARLTALLSLIVATSVVSGTLTDDELGKWLAVVAVAGILPLVDGGVGNVLVNRIASASAEADHRRTMSTALRMSVQISVVILGIYGALALGYATLTSSRTVDITLVGLGVAYVCLTLPLVLFERVLLGRQSFAQLTLVSCGGSILAVVLCGIVALSSESPSVFVLSLAFLSGRVISLALLASIVSISTIKVRPAFGTASSDASMRREAWAFFRSQIGLSLCFSLDIYIVTLVRGSTEAAEYAVVARLVGSCHLIGYFIAYPLWPLLARLFACGQVAEARTLVSRRSRTIFVLTLGATLVASSAISIFGGALGAPTSTRRSTIVACAGFAIVMALLHLVSSLLNGAGVIAPQARVYLLMAAVNISLTFVFVRIWGAPGAPAASATGIVLVAFPLLRRHLNQAISIPSHVALGKS